MVVFYVIANLITIVTGIYFCSLGSDIPFRCFIDYAFITFILGTCIEGVNFLTIVLPLTTTWVVLYQELRIHLTWDQL